jgi:hypothetical protein
LNLKLKINGLVIVWVRLFVGVMEMINLRLKDEFLRLKMSETKIWQSFGRGNGNDEKFVN